MLLITCSRLKFCMVFPFFGGPKFSKSYFIVSLEMWGIIISRKYVKLQQICNHNKTGKIINYNQTFSFSSFPFIDIKC